jgi:spermidine/putrescine-binding protein
VTCRFLDVTKAELDSSLAILKLHIPILQLMSLMAFHCFFDISVFHTAAFAQKMDLEGSSLQGTIKEIELRILCYEGYVSRENLSEFQDFILQKYQKKVNIITENISDEDQIFRSLKNGQVNLISPGIDIYGDERFKLIAKRLVRPINLKWIPNYAEMFIFRKRMPFLTVNNETYGVPFISGIHGLIYNKSKVGIAPKTLKTLLSLKPKSYSITNYPAHLGSMVALMTGHVGNDIFNFEKLMKDKSFLSAYGRIVAGAENLMPGVDRAKDLVNNLYALGFGFSFSELLAKGQEWDFADTEEGHIGWLDSWSIAGGTEKDPLKMKLAHEFINFAISPKYQKNVVVKELSGEPVNEKALPLLDKSEVKRFSRLKKIANWENSRVYLRPLSVKNRNGFRLLYSRSLSQNKPTELAP